MSQGRAVFTFSDIKTGEQVFSFIGEKDDFNVWVDSLKNTFLFWAGNLFIKQGKDVRAVAGLRTSVTV